MAACSRGSCTRALCRGCDHMPAAHSCSALACPFLHASALLLSFCPAAFLLLSVQVPKAFKIIPNLLNWEEVLQLTAPEDWSPHAM